MEAGLEDEDLQVRASNTIFILQSRYAVKRSTPALERIFMRHAWIILIDTSNFERFGRSPSQPMRSESTILETKSVNRITPLLHHFLDSGAKCVLEDALDGPNSTVSATATSAARLHLSCLS